MRTVADSAVLAALTGRLERLTRQQPRVWGAMSPHQMVTHLADLAEAVLRRGAFPAPARRPSRVTRLLALYLPVRWPRGISSGANPASRSLPPDAFEADRRRAITTLAELAAAPADALLSHHPVFGPMTRRDWHRWAFLHVDHHLRQFRS